jgi:oxygen-independent coproporphyrinogen-3 oxidase
VRRVLDVVRGRFSAAPGAEVTIEANPEDVTVDDAASWRAAGVTRVSLGVQSFDDDVLRWMHRTHDATRAAEAASILRQAGFDDWSMDLIFALPPEVQRSWSDDLRRAIDLAPAHISCYGLTIEPHTPLTRWRERGQVHDADEERYEAEFLEAHRTLSGAGYEHYERSTTRRTGDAFRMSASGLRRIASMARRGAGTRVSMLHGENGSWPVRTQ